MQEFKVGDRIVHKSPLFDMFARRGTIVQVSQTAPNGLGQSLSQYTVKWDDGKEMSGYLGVGFEIEVQDADKR